MDRRSSITHVIIALLILGIPPLAPSSETSPRLMRAGAYAIKINPTHTGARAALILDDLYARCFVIDDGRQRAAVVVVDNVWIPNNVVDDIKSAISARTAIPNINIAITATHTHSVPWMLSRTSAERDTEYATTLTEAIPSGVQQAESNLQPARIGWTVIQDWQRTHTRRWIRRSDRITIDPLGERTVRADMHPGFQNPDVIGPAGPSDPDIAIVSFQTLAGKPIALIANYAQHYYGAPKSPDYWANPTLSDGTPLISADYFGAFAERIRSLVAPPESSSPQSYSSPPLADQAEEQAKDNKHASESVKQDGSTPIFVAAMTQGASGDQQWMDYGKPAPYPLLDMKAYAAAIAQEVYDGYLGLSYEDWVPLSVVESKVSLAARRPTTLQVRRAQDVINGSANPGHRFSKYYAESVLYASTLPHTVEIPLQVLRLGDLALTVIPNETYAITGLKIKAQSPAKVTINIANGANGYIPPPEQHTLGGYTTWTWAHFLDSQAEPKVVDGVLRLLEEVSDSPRRRITVTASTYSRTVLSSKPMAYWRLDEFSGPMAFDASLHGREARYETDKGIAFYLPGANVTAAPDEQLTNRAPHLAGGRLTANVPIPRDRYSVELWFWNGLPNDAREITGWLFSTPWDSVGILGSGTAPGRLFYDNPLTSYDHHLAGTTPIAVKTWNHLVLARDGENVNIYLNGKPFPEIQARSGIDSGAQGEMLLFGGRSDPANSLEGKLDEIAIYPRPLAALENLRPLSTSCEWHVMELPGFPWTHALEGCAAASTESGHATNILDRVATNAARLGGSEVIGGAVSPFHRRRAPLAMPAPLATLPAAATGQISTISRAASPWRSLGRSQLQVGARKVFAVDDTALSPLLHRAFLQPI